MNLKSRLFAKKNLYLVLDQPKAFLSNYTPNYEVDKFFRDANRLLIFSTQILKPENNEIEIPSENLFNLLEKRPSVYDIGLSSFLIHWSPNTVSLL